MPYRATQEELDALGDTKVLEPIDIPAPPSQAPFDFEATESHGFPAEHNMLPDETPTKAFAEELPSGKPQAMSTENVKSLKQAVRKRMTDAEAQANMRKAYGGRIDPELANAPDTETELAQMSEHPAKPASMPKAEMAPQSARARLRSAQDDLSRRQAAGDPSAEGFQTYDPKTGRFNPTKTVEQLAQEDAERVLGRKPLSPPQTGTMEGKPVVPETIKVPDAAITPKTEIPNISDDELTKLVNEIQGGAAEPTPGMPGKVMTPGGVVEGGAVPAPKPAGIVKMTAEDIGQTVRSNGGKAMAQMTEGDLGGYSVSLAEKAAAREARNAALRTAARGVGQGLKEFGMSVVKPVTDLYTVPKAALTGWEEAGTLGRTGKILKAGYGLGKGLVKGGLEVGLGLVDEGLARADYNKLTYGSEYGTEDPMHNKGLLGAQAQHFANKQEYNRVANKYGLKVESSDPSVMQMLNPFFNYTKASEDQFQVHEDPALKAAFMKKQHERYVAMQQAQQAQTAQEQEEANAVSPNATPSYVRSDANQ